MEAPSMQPLYYMYILYDRVNEQLTERIESD